MARVMHTGCTDSFYFHIEEFYIALHVTISALEVMSQELSFLKKNPFFFGSLFEV